MLKQFKGIKWVKGNPYYLLFDINKKKLEYVLVSGTVDITLCDKKRCNGYYDLIGRKYVQCPNFFNDQSKFVKQCEVCINKSGFSNCLGCTGFSCQSKNKVAREFCNQSHIVYIAIFGNNKFKVGTAAEYRKFARILEQGAVASMFIALTPNGKIARLIEHTISEYDFVLQVSSKYKINNLIIDKTSDEINELLLKKYELIKNKLPVSLKKYLLKPKINYFEDINEINKKLFLNKYNQISLFDNTSINEYNINYYLTFDHVYGIIQNIVGGIIIVEKDGNYNAYDFKKIEGCIIDFK